MQNDDDMNVPREIPVPKEPVEGLEDTSKEAGADIAEGPEAPLQMELQDLSVLSVYKLIKDLDFQKQQALFDELSALEAHDGLSRADLSLIYRFKSMLCLGLGDSIGCVVGVSRSMVKGVAAFFTYDQSISREITGPIGRSVTGLKKEVVDEGLRANQSIEEVEAIRSTKDMFDVKDDDIHLPKP
ncbi:hypothetical protein [Candidatus Synchoanobacter obligatus]|uniref:Uncharacterized protein n=1 Tax=Candidatus Synchoanobacter obligatus TaxID=2919597 RepID=A0ABT1L6D0_9GAMM|nr:hypothetical protein [Candidatus Synchoanobacter obligatus]MCP8352290.1 hypothetical protein [Candidatus Synchoanobacter obligatus]